MGTLLDVASIVMANPLLAQASQEAVGSGAGKWWLLVGFLATATLLSAIGWFIARRRTIPPAKQAYVPPPLPLRSEAEAGAGQG